MRSFILTFTNVLTKEDMINRKHSRKGGLEIYDEHKENNIHAFIFFLARDLSGSSVRGEIKLFHSSSYPSHLVQYIRTINIFLNEFIE